MKSRFYPPKMSHGLEGCIVNRMNGIERACMSVATLGFIVLVAGVGALMLI